MKITIVAGARPNFMKIAPIVRAIETKKTEGKNISCRLVYTGKKEDDSLETSIFSDLHMRTPDVYLNIEESNHIRLAAGIMIAFDDELNGHPADVVLVVDDLTATMSCAIVAKKRGIQVAHLVAGTRSFDMNMPKEVNRMITDGLSNFLFTAGMVANRNLNQTGTQDSNVFHVGNILIDNIRYNHNHFIRPLWLTSVLPGEEKFLLLTLNRRMLLAKTDKLRLLLQKLIEKTDGTPILAPVHSYVQEAIKATGITAPNLHLLPSQNYLSFGYLMGHAQGIITDSGNIAEEATFLGVPCITLNNYAEHPETWRIGTNELVGEDEELLGTMIERLMKNEWKKGELPERWDGRTAERILQILSENI